MVKQRTTYKNTAQQNSHGPFTSLHIFRPRFAVALERACVAAVGGFAIYCQCGG
jgi:hypothetical protein